MALAVTPLASPGSASGATTLAVNVSSITWASGDLIHVTTTLFDNVGAIIGAPTDSASNSYTKDGQSTWSSTFREVSSFGYAVCGGTSPTTVTANVSGGSTSPGFGVAVSKVVGADTTTPRDASAYGTSTIQNAVSPAITTTAADTVVFVCEAHDGGTTTLAPAATWTQEAEIESATTAPFNSAYKIFAAIQTGLTHTWANGAPRDWGLGAIAYKAAAGGTPQVTGVGAIASLEAFGTTTLRRRLGPPGIPSAEAFGTPKLLRWVGPGGVASLEAFGRPTILGGIQGVSVSGVGAIASLEAFGTPALRRILAAAAIGSTETFGTTKTVRYLGPAGITTGQALGSPRLLRQLAAQGVTSAEAFGTGKIVRYLAVVNIATGEAFGVATVGPYVAPGSSIAGSVALADFTPISVLVADQETYIVGIADVVMIDVTIEDRPGG